jgi:hypothetical protein
MASADSSLIEGVYFANPFAPPGDIVWQLRGDEGSASSILSAVDVAGRLVRALQGMRDSAGRYRVRWDGRDGAGRPAASGTYFLRLSVGGRTVTRRAVLVR